MQESSILLPFVYKIIVFSLLMSELQGEAFQRPRKIDSFKVNVLKQNVFQSVSRHKGV